MIKYTSYTKDNAKFTFIDEDGNKFITPVGSIMLIDDGSDFISVKGIATRKTIAIVEKH